jgi:hypothetical protein
MPGTDLPTADDVSSALDAADFPADKHQLIRFAEEAGAGEAVVKALRSLPLGDYANRAEVLRSLDTVEATGSSPSQHAAQAHQSAPSGLAQHQRSQDR